MHVLPDNACDPRLDSLLEQIGRVGRRVAEMGASEGAAGNISICIRGSLQVDGRFSLVEEIVFPAAVPELDGSVLLVTGSGRRLREVMDEPEANIVCVTIDPGGLGGRIFASMRRRFQRLTSEFNSHLAVHRNHMPSGTRGFHAVIHAQPPYLAYLSHIPRYQDAGHLNRRLLRWQPETVVHIPEGIGLVPFRVPGSPELTAATVKELHAHRIVLWAKHGVMARSAISLGEACDLVEYAETAARYEHLDLCSGVSGEGLSTEEILAVCAAFGIERGAYKEET
ncbi:MAG: rhamnulose-1-phosphate aldolase [Actinobacteria bacterium]|jgi:rhamnulose-1-phosphate aldolase|nr:MAG: rhamnulose-1-phosphate aldolase [Actinomycetota bacterium]